MGQNFDTPIDAETNTVEDETRSVKKEVTVYTNSTAPDDDFDHDIGMISNICKNGLLTEGTLIRKTFIYLIIIWGPSKKYPKNLKSIIL